MKVDTGNNLAYATCNIFIVRFMHLSFVIPLTGTWDKVGDSAKDHKDEVIIIIILIIIIIIIFIQGGPSP